MEKKLKKLIGQKIKSAGVDEYGDIVLRTDQNEFIIYSHVGCNKTIMLGIGVSRIITKTQPKNRNMKTP